MELIQRLLEEMEEPYRSVFTLRIYGELQFSEIAGMYGKISVLGKDDLLPGQGETGAESGGRGWKR